MKIDIQYPFNVCERLAFLKSPQKNAEWPNDEKNNSRSKFERKCCRHDFLSFDMKVAYSFMPNNRKKYVTTSV